MKFAFIMRGLPGSGKSTLARMLKGESGIVHSTDQHHYINGDYCYDESRAREFHDLNFKSFCESLVKGIPVVICDNTNGKHWHFDRYVAAAEQHGYSVAIVSLPHPPAQVAATRTSHKVPLEIIERMILEWEY